MLESRRQSKINFGDPSEVRDVLEVSNDLELGSSQTTSGVPRSSNVATPTSGGPGGGGGGGKKLKTSMIRRINDRLTAVDPNGQPTEQEVDAGESLTRMTSPEHVGKAQ